MIGIVGGGISGLAVALGLHRRGIAHVLFEADDQVGGVMRTVVVDGVPLDVGPQRTRLTREVRVLVEAAGVDDEILSADENLPLWVFRDGRLRRVPLRLSEALTTDLLSLPGKARILLEPFTGPLRADETVARFFTRKFGREAYENMIGPLYGGLYASDPARMLARHGLRATLDRLGVDGSLLFAMLHRGLRARRAIETVTFGGGLQTLPRGLAGIEGVNVRLGTPVRRIDRRPEGGWRLRVEPPRGGPADHVGAGDGVDGHAGVDVDDVVLSCPSTEAAALLESVDSAVAGRIGRLSTNRLAVVHLRSRFEGEGLGHQVAFGEELETRGCTWNASLFARPGVFTCYLGGMKNPGVVDWPDERIADTARREFETVTGSGGEVLRVSRTYMPAWDGTWDALDGLEFPDGLHLCSNWSARPGVPGRAAQAKRLADRLADRLSTRGPGPDREAGAAGRLGL